MTFPKMVRIWIPNEGDPSKGTYFYLEKHVAVWARALANAVKNRYVGAITEMDSEQAISEVVEELLAVDEKDEA